SQGGGGGRGGRFRNDRSDDFGKKTLREGRDGGGGSRQEGVVFVVGLAHRRLVVLVRNHGCDVSSRDRRVTYASRVRREEGIRPDAADDGRVRFESVSNHEEILWLLGQSPSFRLELVLT